MSYRGEISIPVRSENRHSWESSTRSLKEKFAEERYKMETEMENLKRRFHVGQPRSADLFDRSSSSSHYDTFASTDSRNRSNLDRDYYRLERPISTFPERRLDAYPSALEPFRDAPADIKPFGKSPEWRYVETGPDGRKLVKLQFDMAAYHPDEIQVLVDNDYLKIRAKHEDVGPNKSSYREYNREFTLPSVIRSSQITSHLARDGILTVEAPLPHDFDLRRNDLGFDVKVPVEYKR